MVYDSNLSLFLCEKAWEEDHSMDWAVGKHGLALVYSKSNHLVVALPTNTAFANSSNRRNTYPPTPPSPTRLTATSTPRKHHLCPPE